MYFSSSFSYFVDGQMVHFVNIYGRVCALPFRKMVSCLTAGSNKAKQLGEGRDVGRKIETVGRLWQESTSVRRLPAATMCQKEVPKSSKRGEEMAQMLSVTVLSPVLKEPNHPRTAAVSWQCAGTYMHTLTVQQVQWLTLLKTCFVVVELVYQEVLSAEPIVQVNLIELGGCTVRLFQTAAV